MISPFTVLERKRAGQTLDPQEIAALVAGASDGSWGDAELGAFLMAVALQGLSVEETGELTRSMLASGEQWDLAAAFPGVVDKHSTGGVGDKVSLILAPLLAACDVPVAMLTGRSLGHTGGTADKLESIPGLDLALDRTRTLELLRRTGMAIGIATAAVAPADRRLYALRHRTATIGSLPLIVASILSKKLAAGAQAIVFDVKTGSGAFLPKRSDAADLASALVETSLALGRPAKAVITDMSQPLGQWVGHTAEVAESLAALEGRGPGDLMAVTFVLAEEAARLVGREVAGGAFETAISSGAARERFDRWAEAQGASSEWLRRPDLRLAAERIPILAPRSGVLAAVATHQLGVLFAQASGADGRGKGIDYGIALRCPVKIGDAVQSGDILCEIHARHRDADFEAGIAGCFEVGDYASAPELIERG
ncbi:MAG: thymidine phosphorylase [Acidobacteriota bacterium]